MELCNIKDTPGSVVWVVYLFASYNLAIHELYLISVRGWFLSRWQVGQLFIEKKPCSTQENSFCDTNIRKRWTEEQS
jgi:hypothetical protein